MKIRHLYSFFADIYAFSVLALCFLSEITLFAIFDNVACLVSLTTNYKQQNTIRLQQPNNNSPFTRNLIQTNKTPFAYNNYQIKNHLSLATKKTKQPYVVSHETKHKKTLHACSTVKTIQIYNTRHLLHGTA